MPIMQYVYSRAKDVIISSVLQWPVISPMWQPTLQGSLTSKLNSKTVPVLPSLDPFLALSQSVDIGDKICHSTEHFASFSMVNNINLHIDKEWNNVNFHIDKE